MGSGTAHINYFQSRHAVTNCKDGTVYKFEAHGFYESISATKEENLAHFDD